MFEPAPAPAEHQDHSDAPFDANAVDDVGPAVSARALANGRRWMALLPWLAPLGLAGVLCAMVASAPEQPTLRTRGATRYGLSAAARSEAFWQIASYEPVWRVRAAAQFPDHPWSAEDDYHWNVRAHVTRLVAPTLGVHPSAIWSLYDEGVRSAWRVAPPPGSPRRAGGLTQPLRPTIVPLRPRTR